MKTFGFCLAVVAISLLAAVTFAQDTMKVTPDKIAGYEDLIDMSFTPAQRDSMVGDLRDYLRSYFKLHQLSIPNNIWPAVQFNPRPVGFVIPTDDRPIELSPVGDVKMPKKMDDLAFYSVRQLGELIRTKQITSTELTQFFIARLTKYDPMLHCVITLTEQRALDHAAKADSEIAAGHYRGPLHGIPYGSKDLIAAKGYKTTWGSVPYKDQMIDQDATVIQKLDSAGAILVAKMAVGELAMDDVWWGAQCRNPWDTSKGSSGSSAGSASAVSAGCLPFALGTETWGSIVSPSTVCGTTGLRPTYGRVSRTGVMALSWSMDKIGPIARTVEDCAIVFDAIIGTDNLDPSLVNAAYNYTPNVDIKKLRIGYLKDDIAIDTPMFKQDTAAIAALRKMGVQLHEISLPKAPIEAMALILTSEAAAAFDELTRSDRDTLMVLQKRGAWPNIFRAARTIPAAEYVQANRFRSQMILDMARLMDSIDVYVAPSFAGNNLLLTNLTSNPCVVVPNGLDSTGSPVSITFIGRLYDEATVLAVAKAYQDQTGFQQLHPPMFSGGLPARKKK